MSDDDRVYVEVAGVAYKVMPATAQLIEKLAGDDAHYPAEVG